MSKRPGHAPIERRDFLRAGALAALATTVDVSLAESRPSRLPSTPEPRPWHGSAFELEEATIAALQEGMRSGRDTARSIAERYLARMDEIDKGGPAINSVIERNPDAIKIAEERDAERKAGRARGPLHGIPVLIKDNIDTASRSLSRRATRSWGRASGKPEPSSSARRT